MEEIADAEAQGAGSSASSLGGLSHMPAQFFGTTSGCVLLTPEILQKERFHRSYAKTVFDNSAISSRPAMTGERKFYGFLDSVELLVGQMRDLRLQECEISAGDLVEAFLSLALRMDSFAFASYDHHRFKPDIAIVLDVFRSWGPTIRQLVHEDQDWAECRQLVRRCVSLCQRMFRTSAASAARKKYKQRQQENTTSCLKYFDGLLRKHPSQFVFRVDLYAPIRKHWWQLSDLQIAEAGIDHLLGKLRKGQIVESLVGYAVARESGFCRGVHYSLIAVQTGYSPRDGHQAADAVGRAWVASFQKLGGEFLSTANYFNCYSQRQTSPFNEIGRVEAVDPRSSAALRAAIHSMWDVPVMFDAALIQSNKIKNPCGSRDGIAVRNLRKGKT